MMSKSKKIALVTGATSGFGEAIARVLALNGWSLVLTGRRENRLDQLKRELLMSPGISVETFAFDIRSAIDAQQMSEQLVCKNISIDILVNNAGLALGLEPLNQGSVEQWDTMIDTNIKGLLYVTRAIVPQMILRKRGHIINIGSTAAKQTYANGNVYCATKQAVDALSEAMRIDFLPHGIKVTAIHPGAAETEFSNVRFSGDSAKAQNVYRGFNALSANDVAEVVRYCAELPPNVCINDLTLTCLAQANAHYIHKNN